MYTQALGPVQVVNGAKAELQTELSAVAEDIEMLIKENQRLNQLIRGLTAEKHGLQSDIDDQKDQIKQMHATLTDHVTEMNHLRSKLEVSPDPDFEVKDGQH